MNPYKFADLPPINDCPFCFSDKAVVEEIFCFYVICPVCEASGPTHDEKHKAIEMWNGVTNDIDHLRADCDRLRRELDDCNGVIR